MSRKTAIFLVAVAVLVLGSIAGYSLLPKKYKLSEYMTQTLVFWNDEEAFVFVTVNTNGRAGNVVQEKLATMKYGVLVGLLDPPASFFKQDANAWHLLASGTLDRFTLPEQATTLGSWTLHEGKLQLNVPNSRYDKRKGFRWDGEQFVTVVPEAVPQPAPGAVSNLQADDLTDDDQEDGFLSRTERDKFKAAGWHYKVLTAYQGQTQTASLPIPLGQNTFNLTIHTFPRPGRTATSFDLTSMGARRIELSGDRLAGTQILWNQNGWREISKAEYQTAFQKYGHAVGRPVNVAIWLFVLLFLFLWKFAAWGHLLFSFGTVKKKVLKNMATVYTLPPATPAQFPLLDSMELDRYTQEFEAMGFTQLMDFSLVADRGNHPPSFCRLMANTRSHCFGEISQLFPRGKSPMPLKCSIQSRLEDGWTISFSDRKPLAAGSLVRRKKGIGVCMPEATTRDLLQAFLKLRDQVCMELGIAPLTDDTVEGYSTHVQRSLADIREAVQQKSFALGLPQVYMRKLTMVKTRPEYVWLGDYPKEAEQRKQSYAVPAGAH